jgi:hypothetical protein
VITTSSTDDQPGIFVLALRLVSNRGVPSRPAHSCFLRLGKTNCVTM